MRILAAIKTGIKGVYVKPNVFCKYRQLSKVEAVFERGVVVDLVDVIEERCVAALVGCTLGCLGLLRRFGVYLCKRERAICPRHLAALAIVAHHLVHGCLKLLAVGALEVGILDNLHSGIGAAERVVGRVNSSEAGGLR